MMRAYHSIDPGYEAGERWKKTPYGTFAHILNIEEYGGKIPRSDSRFSE